MRLHMTFLAVAVFLLPFEASARDPLLGYFEGTWGTPGASDSCEKNANDIRFSESGETAHFSYTEPIPGPDGIMSTEFQYKVLGVAGNGVRMQLVGETRTTEDGELVVWDLMRISDDSYCWHRADWQPDHCTAPWIRCQSMLDDMEKKASRRTAEVLRFLQSGSYRDAAAFFSVATIIEPAEHANEFTRLANSLEIVIRELGSPTKWAEMVQLLEEFPDVVNVAIGPSHVLVEQEHGKYFIAIFEVHFAREGHGYFRAAFDSRGEIRQMTFSLPRERTERMAEIGEILLRETAHEF